MSLDREIWFAKRAIFDPCLVNISVKRPDIRDVHRGAAAAGFFKELTRRGRFFKIHCGSGSIFFEDIEKVHEFDRILVFTSETS